MSSFLCSQDRFKSFGFGADDDEDDIIEDDFSAAHNEENSAHPYGPPGVKQTAINWFRQTQLQKLRKPYSDQLYEWFHGIIPRT